MNLVATDHPMNARASRLLRHLRRWFLGSLLIYPAWLLLLGPFWALDGHGTLDFLPFKARQAVYLPAVPFCYSPSLYAVFDGYMNWWYLDPNTSETTW
jgi:hypothetical protein